MTITRNSCVERDAADPIAALRDACRQVITALGDTRDSSVQDEDVVRRQAMASVEHVHEVAERFSTAKERLWRELDSPAELDRLRRACQGKVARLEARLGGGV